MSIKSKVITGAGILIFAIVIIFSVVFIDNPPPANSAGVPDKGTVAPDFALATMDGKTVRLSDYRGQIVFLNFWATWCPPCRNEMPAMEKLHKVMQGYDFVILAVSIDQATTYHVKSFVNKKRYSFPVLHDVTKEVAANYGVSGIPTTLIVDKGGVIVSRLIGGRAWDSDKIVDYFKELAK